MIIAYMKPIQILLLISTTLFTSKIVAQEALSNKPAVIIKADIVLPVVGLAINAKGGSLTLEFGFKRRHSIQLTGLGYTATISESQHDKSMQIIPAYKYFLSKKKEYAGFYSGLYLRSTQYQSTIDHKDLFYSFYLEYKQNYLGGGLIFGYQNYIKERIVIDVLLGWGVGKVLNTTVVKSENVELVDIDNSPASGIMAVNIGYKF